MKIGITLSGGGARGIAHLGVLHALEELEIPVHRILGVSAGGIAGALYSEGYKPSEILEIVEKTNFLRWLRPVFFGGKGLLNIETLTPLLKDYIPHNSFEKLKIPLATFATDIEKGEGVFFNEGELIKPILASSCIPVIFNPVKFQGRTLVDGGVFNNMPIDTMFPCDFKIGVHVNPYKTTQSLNSIRSILERSLLLSIHSNAKSNFPIFNLVIEPDKLWKYAPFQVGKAKEIYEIGYLETYKHRQILENLKLTLLTD